MNLFGYRRNLPQNNQTIYKFFVILRTKLKGIRDSLISEFHEDPSIFTDPDPFGKKCTNPDPDPSNPDKK